VVERQIKGENINNKGGKKITNKTRKQPKHEKAMTKINKEEQTVCQVH
jgi:hypothetical protein